MAQPRIGKFEVEEALPGDWLGARHLARELDSGDQVFLRAIAPRLLKDPAVVMAIRSLPGRLHGFSHPGIASILETGQWEGGWWVAALCPPGETLAARLAAEPGPWPQEKVLRIIGALASALDVAHAAGLVHGNLAADQVVLAQDLRPVITDLGLAWSSELTSGLLVSPAGPDLAPTTAPEQQDGAPGDARADLYALAVLAFRMLAGSWPLTRRPSPEITQPHLTQSPGDPVPLDASLDEELAGVLRRGLAEEPAQRYPTAAAFVAALQDATRPWQRIGLQLVRVPAGRFTYGEGTSATVLVLPAFEIAVFPVTVAQFAAFVEAAGYVTQAEREGWGLAYTGTRWEEVPGACWWAPRGPGSSVEGKAAHPVVQVSGWDALAFCDWAGLALPDGRQWEAAARGDDARRYPWGDRWRPELCNHAGAGLRDTAPVDRYPGDASPCGARGMAGNVWEWTSSAFDAAGEYRVLRGGAWPHEGRYLTATFRYYALPGYRCDALGFRCVRIQDGKRS
jgi:formylglycine-generating enzyme